MSAIPQPPSGGDHTHTALSRTHYLSITPEAWPGAQGEERHR